MKSKIEQYEQIRLAGHLTRLEHEKKIITYYAIPNGGSRHHLEAINMKKEGVRAGVSDICVIHKDKTLYIEMKRPPKKLKSGKLSYSGISVSDKQIEFIEKTNSVNYISSKVCYGFNEAKEFIFNEIGVK